MKMKVTALSAAALALLLIAGCKPSPPLPKGELKTYTVKNTRDMRYGELIVARRSGVQVYNTTGLNDCPADVWNAIDAKQLAKELHALKVVKNGPHFWMMDEQTLTLGDTVTLAGLQARWAASVELKVVKAQMSGHPYTIYTPKKTQWMRYDKGKPVYELVDAEGNAYVLQAHNKEWPMESLATMGAQMKQLPEGWSYRTRILTEDLVIDLSDKETIYAVGDEFNQYYTRVPKSK